MNIYNFTYTQSTLDSEVIFLRQAVWDSMKFRDSYSYELSKVMIEPRVLQVNSYVMLYRRDYFPQFDSSNASSLFEHVTGLLKDDMASGVFVTNLRAIEVKYRRSDDFTGMQFVSHVTANFTAYNSDLDDDYYYEDLLTTTETWIVFFACIVFFILLFTGIYCGYAYSDGVTRRRNRLSNRVKQSNKVVPLEVTEGDDIENKHTSVDMKIKPKPTNGSNSTGNSGADNSSNAVGAAAEQEGGGSLDKTNGFEDPRMSLLSVNSYTA